MKNYNRNYYNAQGQRVAKRLRQATQYYIHDATGNRLATYNLDIRTNKLSWTEQTLYGSSRLGVINPNINATLANPTDSFAVKSLTQYELTNHLGNVMTTITDRKLLTGASYSPVVQTATDYYAFGAPIAERSFNASGYRYGFNGKENVTEIKDIQDYGFRYYNTLTARFLSVDPLTKKYPELTPYQFASNSPIQGIDYDGLELLKVNTGWYRMSVDNGGSKIVVLKEDNIPSVFKNENGSPLFTPNSVGINASGYSPKSNTTIQINEANSLPQSPEWGYSTSDGEPTRSTAGAQSGSASRFSTGVGVVGEIGNYMQLFKNDVSIWKAYPKLTENNKAFGTAATLSKQSLAFSDGFNPKLTADVTNFIFDGSLPQLNKNNLGTYQNEVKNMLNVALPIMNDKSNKIEIRPETKSTIDKYLKPKE